LHCLALLAARLSPPAAGALMPINPGLGRLC
jgi:hypothetical protein